MIKVKKFIKIMVIAICVFFVLRQISMWIPFNSETHVGSLYDYIQNKIAWWHLYMSGYLG